MSEEDKKERDFRIELVKVPIELSKAAEALVDPQTGDVKKGTIVAFVTMCAMSMAFLAIAMSPGLANKVTDGLFASLSSDVKKATEETKQTNLELAATNKKLDEQKKYLEDVMHAGWYPVSASEWTWQAYPGKLRAGKYLIRAHGSWTVAYDDSKVLSLQATAGPNGHKGHPLKETMPISNRPAGSLICKINTDDEKPIFIGEQEELELKEPTELYFLCNDGDWPDSPQSVDSDPKAMDDKGKPLSIVNSRGVSKLNGYRDNLGTVWVQVLRKLD